MWVKKQQLELDMEEQTGSELGKNTTKLYMSPCLFNLYARVHHEKRWAGRSTTGVKIARRNLNHLRYADDTTLMVESKEELKILK